MSYPKQSILFVSGLDKGVSENMLSQLFTDFPISYIKIAKDHSSRESFGYAFVGFRSHAKAEEALNKLNYHKLAKKTIRISWYNREPNNNRNDPNFNVFVKKIAKGVNSKEFHSFFSKYGNIISARLVEDEEGEVIGYGFVQYDNPDSANIAIREGNNIEWKGKNLFVGQFLKNKPKRVAQFNNIYSFSSTDVENYFRKFGDLGSVLIKEPDMELLEKLPENKRHEILSHKFAFVCFKEPEAARRAVNEVPYSMISNNKYNEELTAVCSTLTGIKVPQEHLHKCACYIIDNVENYKNMVDDQNKLKEIVENFLKNLQENEKYYFIKDKSDRMDCCQALKRKDRLKELKNLHEKNKKIVREKYKFCNLYVKNLPDNMDDEGLKKIFEQYGKIRSARAVRKELYQSYLGIKRSVKVFGFICFDEQVAAKEAKLALNGTNVFPHLPKLFVDYHQSKNERNEFLKLQMINQSYKMFQKNGQGQDVLGFGAGGQPNARGFQMRPGNDMRQAPLMFGPHMLRKFPPQTGFNNPKGFNNPFPNQNQMPNFMQQQFMQQAQQQQAPIDVSMMDPTDKRDFFGDKLFLKITSNSAFAQYSELFSKIVGIFLDLNDEFIMKLIKDDNYFNTQVNEAIKQLVDKITVSQ